MEEEAVGSEIGCSKCKQYKGDGRHPQAHFCGLPLVIVGVVVVVAHLAGIKVGY